MGHGPLWDRIDAEPRRLATELAKRDLPTTAGVYAWYRGGRAVYVGKGDELQDRVWRRHMGQSRSLHTSSFRRNVAELLGFGLADDIYRKRVRLTDEQRADVRAWILTCSVAWIECPTSADARRLETNIKAEWLPPLTKR